MAHARRIDPEVGGRSPPRGSGVRRGFPHLELIHDSLKRLVPAIKRGTLPPPSPQPWSGWTDYDTTEPTLSVQRLARRIAEVFGLDVGTIVVSFHDNVEFAGRVELGASRDFFVEVHAQFRAQPRVIAAVLGHEVAHIFLHRRQLALAETLPNEILTDTTAALYGFGALMADTFEVSEKREQLADAVRVTRTEQALGYLTPDELGYVLTRSGFARVEEYLRSAAARDALQVGRERAVRELRTPPLALAPWWSRLLYRLWREWASWRRLRAELRHHTPYAFQEGRIAFRCPHCCQGMRLPLRQKLVARCPSCELEVACVT